MCMTKYIDPFTDFGFNIASFLNLSKDEQFAYQLDMKARLDYKNTLDTALQEGIKEGLQKGFKQGIEKGLQEGIEKGLQEGEKKKTIEIAKNLLDILDNETISKKTGLTIKEIQDLRK